VLPLKERPKTDRVKGHVLEEVKVLAAAPLALRKLVASTGYDKKGGVEAEFSSGIEVRFGDEREAARKWEAAATILADPSVTLLSYVDVTAPSRPATGGEGHELPAAREGLSPPGAP
jgi:cell division protein FtsQ